MPVDSVVVELVEDGEAVLGRSALLQLAVVRLGLADTARGGPVVLVSLGGRGQFLQHGRPEPAVDADGLQVCTLAALEVTDSAGRPDIFHLEEISSVLVHGMDISI